MNPEEPDFELAQLGEYSLCAMLDATKSDPDALVPGAAQAIREELMRRNDDTPTISFTPSELAAEAEAHEIQMGGVEDEVNMPALIRSYRTWKNVPRDPGNLDKTRRMALAWACKLELKALLWRPLRDFALIAACLLVLFFGFDTQGDENELVSDLLGITSWLAGIWVVYIPFWFYRRRCYGRIKKQLDQLAADSES